MKYGTYLSPDVGPPALPSYMIQGTNTTECLRKSTWRRLNNTALVCPPADRNNYSGSDQSLGREHWKLCLVYRVVLYNVPSVSQLVFTITEKAPTRAFS